MTTEEFLFADACFEIYGNSQIGWLELSDPLLEAFSHAVQDFEFRGRPYREEPVLEETVAALRRQRRDLSVVPTRFDNPFFETERCLALLDRVAKRITFQFPAEVGESLGNARRLLQEIGQSSESPLLDAIHAFVTMDQHRGVTVIVPKRRYVNVVRDSLISRLGRKGVKVLTAGDFEVGSPVDLLIVCGSTHWYRDQGRYLLVSPHARRTLFAHWSWIRDELPTDSLLRNAVTSSQKVAQPSMSDSSAIEGDDLLPKLDWGDIQSAFVEASGLPGESIVPARAVMLAGGLLTTVAESEGAKEMLLDPENGGSERVREISGFDLRPGDMIIRRTQGSEEEFIEAVADGLLGTKRAAELRGMQLAWKSALQDVVDRFGEDETVRRLLSAGSIIATPVNLRNWLSPNSIKTNDPRDFASILGVCGLGDRLDSFWKGMTTIFGKHIQAGREIRQMLVAAFTSADVSIASADGRVDVTLADERAGVASAVRVEAISPNTIRIPSHMLRRVIKGGGEWLE